MSVTAARKPNRGFRDRLDQLLEENGLSVEALERATGIPKSTTGNWRTRPEPSVLQRIRDLSRHFNVSADWLLGLTEERRPLETGKVFVNDDHVQIIENAKTWDDLRDIELVPPAVVMFSMTVPEKWHLTDWGDSWGREKDRLREKLRRLGEMRKKENTD